MGVSERSLPAAHVGHNGVANQNLGAHLRLPGMQGLSVSSSDTLDVCYAWKGFPQLKLLKLDWLKYMQWQKIQHIRCPSLMLPVLQRLRRH